MILADKICACRRQQGLSQEALAARLHVSRQAVSKWETGDTEPESGKLVALARIFGVTVDWLLSEDARFQEETETLSTQTSSESAVPQPQGILKKKAFANLRWGYVLYLCCLCVYGFIAIVTRFGYDPQFAWSIHFARLSIFFDPITLLSMLTGSILLLWGSGLLRAAAQAFRFMFSQREYEACPAETIPGCRRGVRTALVGFVLGGVLSVVTYASDFSMYGGVLELTDRTLSLLPPFLLYSIAALFVLLPVDLSLKQRQER